MYDMDKRFQPIISKDIMSYRPLHISEISRYFDVPEALKRLGRFASHVTIGDNDIQYKQERFNRTEEVIRLIGESCSGDHLRILTLFLLKSKNSRFRYPVPHCLQNIEHLAIHGSKHLTDNLIESLLDNCPNINSLSLRRICTSGKMLMKLGALKLKCLSLEFVDLTDDTVCSDFLKTGIASLISLQLDTVCLVPECLEVFHRIDFPRMFPKLEKLFLNSASYTPLMEITTLKNLSIKVKDLDQIQIFNDLKCNGKLEHLTIQFICNHFTAFSDDTKQACFEAVKNLTSLKSITIYKHYFTRFTWDDTIEMIRNIPQIETVCLFGIKKLSRKNLLDFVTMSPAVTCLKLYLPVRCTMKLYNSMLRERKTLFWKSPVLNIHFNPDRVNILKTTIVNYAEKANCIALHGLIKATI